MRLLIANRGEIAVRIARTAHRLGLETVGVYSEPDRAALHADVVDVAVALGGQTPADSYLRADKILAVARRQRCDAVHPGYGFLSENAAFARAVVNAGLVWIGPTPEQIALLGDKIAAKRTARAAGVPTTPVQPAAGTAPGELDYPVLIKAAAGGGGRGMRVVRSADDYRDAVEAARREAQAAFGDPTVFVEPFLESARHIEVQIFGDHHGTVIHLGERDCSIQRRSQKVIEESPAPGLADAVREQLHTAAVDLARHVGYQGAGTVEFLVDSAGTGITFLEVNTRLQVEHPVTELVTGLDLVELQLRVAGGAPLGLTQSDVRISGHAIEARIVSERPADGWLPAAGILTDWAIACGDDSGVRVDAGVRPGSVVSTDYDSLLAKVIAHGGDRTQAVDRLVRALRGARVHGVETNVAAVRASLANDDFRAGAVTTDFLERHPELSRPAAAATDRQTETTLLIAASLTRTRITHDSSPWAFAPAGWRNIATDGTPERWRHAPTGELHELGWTLRGANTYAFLHGAPPRADADGILTRDDRDRLSVRVLAWNHSETRDVVALEVDGVRRLVDVTCRPDGSVTTSAAGGSAAWTLAERTGTASAANAVGDLLSPLPGTVIGVHVHPGDVVEIGQVLVLVEAMKVEHTLVAAGAATVAAVRVQIGDRVGDGDTLIELLPAAVEE